MNTMEERFEAWWADKKRSTYAQMISQAGEDRAKLLAREAWNAALDNRVPSLVANTSTAGLLQILAERGGVAGALGEAGLLAVRKGEDYGTDAERDAYFPLGLASHAQMLHVKSQRMISLAKLPREQHFESARDTALDIINYGSFCADWLQRTGRTGG